MRIKHLFTVPEGQKVTEKVFGRVLLSSICSILLCMSCLAGTTWAWFAVSIENTGNEIWIGEPKINMTVGDSAYVSGTELSGKDITLCLAHANEFDDFEKKSTLYVTLTLHSGGKTTTVYTTLNEGNQYSTAVKIENAAEAPFSVSWAVSWFVPPNAVELTGDTITLAPEEPDPTEAPTDPQTAPSAEETTTPETETQPEVTEEAATEATEEASEEENAAE